MKTRKRISVSVMLAAAALVLSLVAFTSDASAADSKGKLKIFILAGQSNMVGHCRAHTMATLFNLAGPKDKDLIKLVFKDDAKISKQIFDEQVARAKKLDELTGGISGKKIKAITDAAKKEDAEAQATRMKAIHEAYKKDVASSCVVSDRVYINGIADRNKKSGKLGVGYGGDPAKIGPEYTFGLSIAKKIEGPILLIKTSYGGRSLNYDFRPPSAGPYQLDEKQKNSGKGDEILKKAGHNYRSLNESIQAVLKNLKANHPAYDPKAGYEIAGFVWFQGFNDQFSTSFKANYKDCMIAFIKDIRKEYKTPKMPFIIGVLGTSMTKEKVAENAISVAQRQAAKAPEFKGNVLAVESYTEYSLTSYKVYKSGWADHYHHWDTVGSDRPYHYLGAGAFFARLGDSFATSMAKLIANQKK
jgi:hypothetical protein